MIPAGDFYVVDEAKELTEILSAPLEQWRVFLHPKQRKLVSMQAGGPVRVLGGAGTGKTVVAMHRAKYLAEQVFTGKDDRVLVTTFTKNLATDIFENLRKICSAEAMARIEVVNLDAWVSNFLRTQGYRHQVVFDDEGNECWRNALNLVPGELGAARELLSHGMGGRNPGAEHHQRRAVHESCSLRPRNAAEPRDLRSGSGRCFRNTVPR